MGAGCCRAHVLPGPGPHAPPPRPAWGPGGLAWGSAAPDPSIANLRPGDKFHFNREQFIRQHLVVPEKAFSSSNGVHNPAFTSDGGVGVLAVRPALPSLPTPPPSPAPVPPPRKKRRARPQQQLGPHGPHGPHGPPPLPPSRSRAGSRVRGKEGQPEDEEELAVNPNDSILSPAHTMELLKRMAKVEARLGGARVGAGAGAVAGAAPRARSMDSLDVLDASGAARGRSLPGRGRGSAQEHYDVRPEGPRSLDLDLNKEEGVVGVAGFSLQSWEERRGRWSASAAAPAPAPAPASLLCPRQWRPLSPSDNASPSSSRASSPHQAATTRALSEFIRDTYTAQLDGPPGSHADPAAPAPTPAPAPASAPASAQAPAPAPALVISSPQETAAAPAAAPAALLTVDPVQCSADDETGECVPGRLIRDASPDGDRPSSSASSTTESLEELGDDILHMLSTTSDKAESEAGDETGPDTDGVERRTVSASAALPSSELVRQQQRQYSLAEAAAGVASRDIVPVS